MPHTNRKKKNNKGSTDIGYNNNYNSKRILVVDEETGWTRVTKQSNLNNINNLDKINKDDQNNNNNNNNNSREHGHDHGAAAHILVPGPGPDKVRPQRTLTIPADASVAKTAARYNILEQRWLESESWAVLKAALTSTTTSISSRSRSRPRSGISTFLLLGSGSPTALLQGWIDRSHVALVQIAVFRSVVETIIAQQQQQQQSLSLEQGDQHQQKHRPEQQEEEEEEEEKIRIYAQEPDYNEIDIAFLRTLGIETVDHPGGFEMISSSASSSTDTGPGTDADTGPGTDTSTSTSARKCFVYAPGAEIGVATRALSAQPWMYLGHELDHYSSSSSSHYCSQSQRRRRRQQGQAQDQDRTTQGENDHGHNHDHDQDQDQDKKENCDDKDKASSSIIQRFQATHSALVIPDLDDGFQDYPFHQQRLYYYSSDH